MIPDRRLAGGRRLDSPHADLLLFDGRWTREFAPVRQTLATGLIAKENRSGRTSHYAPPFAVVGEQGFSETRGEAFALHLAWSGITASSPSGCATAVFSFRPASCCIRAK
uniref:Glycosyl hydrolase family 36 N-terminal domain-containing protein n=1 Tax=Phenylobacterium glaciei TaxID=2803784 RepID=A0A974SAU2_9CAUL|nr:hypothetical protein JKL49_26075 [Phenylobacterium glaciei]